MKSIVNLITSRNYALFMMIFVLIIPFASATSNSFKEMGTYSTSTESFATSSNMTNASSSENLVDIPEATFGTKERVRKGKILEKDDSLNSFKILNGSSTIMIYYTATSTFYTGEEEQASIDDINSGTLVYVFGYIKSDKSAMNATKIIIANKAKFWTLRQN